MAPPSGKRPGPARNIACSRTACSAPALLKSVTAAARAARRVTSCTIFHRYTARATSSMANKKIKNSTASMANSTAKAPPWRWCRLCWLIVITQGRIGAQRYRRQLWQPQAHQGGQEIDGHVHGELDAYLQRFGGISAAVIGIVGIHAFDNNPGSVGCRPGLGQRLRNHLLGKRCVLCGRADVDDLRQRQGCHVARRVMRALLHDRIGQQRAAKQQHHGQQAHEEQHDQRQLDGGHAPLPAPLWVRAPHNSSSAGPASACSNATPANSALSMPLAAGAVMKNRPIASTLTNMSLPPGSGQASKAILSTRRCATPTLPTGAVCEAGAK